MTIFTFPSSLPGLSFPVKRTPTFQTIPHVSVSGVATAQSPQPYASYAYELPFEFLRSDSFTLEQQTLLGFYLSCRGAALPFHFLDPDDFQVTGQTIGIGDGVTTDFGLARTMVSAVDQIQDADAGGMVVYDNGVSTAFTALTTAQYVTIYGVRVTPAPLAGHVITADFTYKFLCRFVDDTLEFSKFMYDQNKGVWSAAVKFKSSPQ